MCVMQFYCYVACTVYIVHIVPINLLPQQGRHKDIHSKGEVMETPTQGHPFLIGAYFRLMSNDEIALSVVLKMHPYVIAL